MAPGEPEVDYRHAGVEEFLFTRSAGEHGQHAGINSSGAESVGEQDDLLLGTAEPQLSDQQVHLCEFLGRSALPGSCIVQDTLITQHTHDPTLSKAKLANQWIGGHR